MEIKEATGDSELTSIRRGNLITTPIGRAGGFCFHEGEMHVATSAAEIRNGQFEIVSKSLDTFSRREKPTCR
jgi:hypothetical protein